MNVEISSDGFWHVITNLKGERIYAKTILEMICV